MVSPSESTRAHVAGEPMTSPSVAYRVAKVAASCGAAPAAHKLELLPAADTPTVGISKQRPTASKSIPVRDLILPIHTDDSIDRIHRKEGNLRSLWPLWFPSGLLD